MRVRSAITLDPGDPHPPPGCFVEDSRRPGRPQKQYRLRLWETRDVEVARRIGFPVYLLTSHRVRELGVSTNFPPQLLVAQEFAPAVDTEYRTILFRYAEFARTPRIEDLVVALLSVDPLTARLLALRNRRFVDPARLAERVVQEGVAGPATRVGLRLLAPEIPGRGSALPEPTLLAHDRGHHVVGVRA